MKYLKIIKNAPAMNGRGVSTPFVGSVESQSKQLFIGKEFAGSAQLKYEDGLLHAVRYTLEQLQLPMDAVYTLKYEDESFTPLPKNKYESIYAVNGTLTYENTQIRLTPSNFAPYLAKYLGIYNSDNERVGGICISDTPLYRTFGERSYRVGLFSDVHYNDIGGEEYEPQGPDLIGGNELAELQNALKFFEEKESISFICCAGDLSTNYMDHIRNFREITDAFAPTTPVYSCKGNHDNAASYNNNEEWLKYTIPANGVAEITYFQSGDKTSFYFTKNDSGTTDVYIFFNVNYQSGDSMSNGRCYLTEDIKELQSVLDAHRNDRCFIFTHMFFPQKAGTPCDDYTTGGNSHSANYYLHNRDFAYLNELNNYYVNTVWFSGHSHYQWKWQQDSTRANVCNWDTFNGEYMYDDLYDGNGQIKNTAENYKSSYMRSAWNVHLPSTCRPLRLGKHYGGYSIAIIYMEDGISWAGAGSEGGVMDIYKDYVDIRGIVFRSEIGNSLDFTNRYSFLANYRLEVGGDNNVEIESREFSYFRNIVNNRYTKINESMSLHATAVVDETKTNADASGQTITVESDASENPAFVFTFTNCGQRFLITNYITTSVAVDSIQITWNGADVTDKFTKIGQDGCPYSEEVLGFYGTDPDTGISGYYTSEKIECSAASTSSGYGLQFATSQSKIVANGWPDGISPSAEQPLTVKVAARFYKNEDDD